MGVAGGKAYGNADKAYGSDDNESQCHDFALRSMTASWMNPLKPSTMPKIRKTRVKLGAILKTLSR